MRYIVSLSNKPHTISINFEPRTIMTDVKEPGKAVITGIFFGERNELLQEIDAWLWSADYVMQVHNDFLKQYGMEKAEPEEIDRWLDLSGLSMPEPNRLMLPMIRKNTTMHVEMRGSCSVVLSGRAY